MREIMTQKRVFKKCILIYIYIIQPIKSMTLNLPENINILTFEPRSDGDFLLGLEHHTFDDSDKK